MKVVEPETHIPEETERPLKWIQLSHKDVPSYTGMSPNSHGAPLKKPKLELEDLPFAIPRSQTRAKTATGGAVLPQLEARNKGKLPVLADTQPDVTNESASDLGLHLRHLRDQGKESTLPHMGHWESRSICDRPSHGMLFKEPKPKGTALSSIKTKEEPVTDDALPLLVPFSVIRTGKPANLVTAPNPRVLKAFLAMREIGISLEKTKPVLKHLLKIFKKNWEAIEAEDYKALAVAISDREEAEGKQPVLADIQSDVTNESASDLGLHLRHLGDKGKEPVLPQMGQRESRKISDRPSHGVLFKEPKPKGIALSLIRPKTKPSTDDKLTLSAPLSVFGTGKPANLVTAPNPRVVKAFRAMGEIGIPVEKTKPVLKHLLKIFKKKWEPIEAEDYRALADAISESEEAERMKVVEAETQIPEETEWPLKRLQLSHQDVPSYTGTSPNSHGAPLKILKLELDDLPFAIPRSQAWARTATVGTILPQLKGRDKGKQPVLSDTHPNVTNESASDSDLRLKHLIDKGKGPILPQMGHRESRSISDRPSHGVLFKEPKPKGTILSLIKPKDEPVKDDVLPLLVPLSVIRTDRIEEELVRMQNKAVDLHVDEVECLKRDLGERSGHTRGVGLKPKNGSYDVSASAYVSTSYYDELKEQVRQANEQARQANKRWQQQQKINEQMQQQINQLLAVMAREQYARSSYESIE